MSDGKNEAVKKGKHLFKPGQSGNPGGRKPMPEDLKKIKEAVKVEFDTALHTQMRMTQSEIHNIHCDSKSTAIQLVCARFIQRAINEGDVARFALICDRVLGSVPRPIQALDADGKPKDTSISLFQSMDADQLTQFVINLRARAEACKSKATQSQQLQELLPPSSQEE